MKFNKYLFFALLLIITSCKKDEDEPKGAYESGVFILNQGKFPGGASAVTFISDADVIDVDIFAKENTNNTLAPVAQGMLIKGDNAYISLNNGNEIKVVDANTFKEKTTILGVAQPRYFVSNGSDVLVSQWGSTGFDGSIKIIGSDNNISGEIKTERAPDKMLIQNNKLYVTMSNGFSQDSFLRIYNLSTNALISELILSAGPNSIVTDNSNNIWVLCGGYLDWLSGNETAARLYKITNDKVASFIQLEGTGSDNLITNAPKNKLYFTSGGKVVELNLTTNTQTDITISGVNAFFYGLAYSNPLNAIYVSDPKDYASQGSVYRIDLDDNTVKEFKTGVVPAQIYIKE